VKRRKCLNCLHADVIRYGKKDRRFPIGVFCDFDSRPEDSDPRLFVKDCTHVCDRWVAKTARTNDPAVARQSPQAGGSAEKEN
jgi:hypothetical protein